MDADAGKDLALSVGVAVAEPPLAGGAAEDDAVAPLGSAH